MNRNLLIGIAVIVLVVLGWWIFSSPKTSTDNTAQPSADNTTTTTGTSGSVTQKQTFKSLITQKGSYLCTYEQVSTSGKSTNSIYIADGRLRGEFRDSNLVGNMMVYDGVYLYTWKEGTAVGTKMVLKSLAQLPTIIPKDLTSGASFGTNFDSVGWDCHQWIKDAKLLAPPVTVKFSTV